MSGTVFYRYIRDLCGNHQQGNLNKIANHQPILDIPIHFESGDRTLNNFSLVDTQKFLNESISPLLKRNLINLPSNQNFLHFVAYYDLSYSETLLSNLNKNLVFNQIFLRRNPVGSQNLTNFLEISQNTIFSNSINYLELEKGGIIKRSENLKDLSSNMHIFITEVSNNLITSRNLGDPFETNSSVDFSFNQRNFNNLFPSRVIPSNQFRQSGLTIPYYYKFVEQNILNVPEDIKLTYGNISKTSLVNKFDSAISDFNQVPRPDNWQNRGFNESQYDTLISNKSILDRSQMIFNRLPSNTSYKAGLYFYRFQAKINGLPTFQSDLQTQNEDMNNGTSIKNDISFTSVEIQQLFLILERIQKSFLIHTSESGNPVSFTPFIVYTTNNNNVIFLFINNNNLYILCVKRNEQQPTENQLNDPYKLFNYINAFELPILLFGNRLPLIVDFKINYDNYSRLFVDRDNVDENQNINFFNTITNVYGQTFNIPSFGVQRLLVNTSDSTQPQLTHLDNINPRSTNLLYGLYSTDTQSDISYLSTEYYNINFNEKSWFMGNKIFEFNQGINIGNLVFTNDTNGHFMYKYCLNFHQNPNYLLQTDTSNIPYTILGDINNGKISFGDISFQDISSLTYFDSSQTLFTFNSTLTTKIEDPIYKQVCAIAALYYKDSTKNFVYNISNELISTINWNDDQYIQTQNSSTDGYFSSYHLIPFNQYFYKDVSQNTSVINEAQLFLNPLFNHVRSILYAKPDYCLHTTLIGTGDVSGSGITIPQIMSLFDKQSDTFRFITDNIFKVQPGTDNDHTLDTQIVGICNENLYYKISGSGKGNVYGNVNDFLTNPTANLNVLNGKGFKDLQRIYLRMSKSTITDISINANSLSNNSKFYNNNLINVLDLSDFSNVKLNFTPNSLNNMLNLQHIIVNNLVDISNIYDLSINTNPHLKAIYRIREDTNITRTIEPQKITHGNKSIVVMDIPYNTNVLFPNPSLFTISNT